MKVMIDIPKDRYKKLLNPYQYNESLYDELKTICRNATPLEEKFEWCHDCKEYDTEKHCCHRWTKVIRNTLNDNINAVLEDIKAAIMSVKFDKPLMSKGYECYGFLEKSKQEVVNEIIEIIDNHISGKE